MQITIRNETPCNLELKGTEGQLTLSPLEVRQYEEKDLADLDLAEAQRAGLIKKWKEEPSDISEKIVSVAPFAAAGIFAVCSVLQALKEPPFFKAIWQPFVWISGIVLFVLIIGGVALAITRSWTLFRRVLGQTGSLLLILAIGLGLPALTIYFFGEGKALLEQPSPLLFARLLQIGFISTASLLPVLLFFLFDRYQLSTMRDRLYRDLFRLDRTSKRRSEIDAKYGAQIRELYGPEDQNRGRLTRGTRSPVLVCAFVMTMGWLAAFKPIGSVNQAVVGRPLAPEQTALAFGFLGAYFFGLQLISRRYARGDLKPKAYAYVTTRIIIVAVLSWVLELLYKGEGVSSTILVVAFLIGIVPEEFFTLIKENLRGRGPARLVPESEKHPLTRLEGIDLYDRARLEQEGIVNVESLAHSDLIQLMLETQIPVPRLVDWMDQAILYLHTIEEPDKKKQAPAAAQKLREYGIRTATDLLACWDAAKKRDPEGKQGELEDFKALLGRDGKVYRLEVIRDALLDDEWLRCVQDWRNDDPPETRSIDARPEHKKR
jgi:hypothetical protein